MSAANESWVWIDPNVLYAVHDEQLAEHGGGAGVRDAGLFESALARPVNLAHYGEPDAADLAAAYGFGIARNHPFIDGNKRTALAAALTFLSLNGHDVMIPMEGCAEVEELMLTIADGKLEREEATARFKDFLTRIGAKGA